MYSLREFWEQGLRDSKKLWPTHCLEPWIPRKLRMLRSRNSKTRAIQWRNLCYLYYQSKLGIPKYSHVPLVWNQGTPGVTWQKQRCQIRSGHGEKGKRKEIHKRLNTFLLKVSLPQTKFQNHTKIPNIRASASLPQIEHEFTPDKILWNYW